MSAAIQRLYAEFVEATDLAARSMDNDRRHIARLETEICAQLANQPGGVIVIDRVEFRMFEVRLGKETLQYFRVTIFQEHRVEANGYGFARRRADPDPVIPVAATQKRRGAPWR